MDAKYDGVCGSHGEDHFHQSPSSAAEKATEMSSMSKLIVMMTMMTLVKTKLTLVALKCPCPILKFLTVAVHGARRAGDGNPATV